MVQKGKNTIPVIDICNLHGTGQRNDEIVAEPFAAYLKVHPNLFKAHRNTFYHMVLFTKGRGTHSIDFERFNVSKGQVYFMIPGQVHSWSFEDEVDGYIINFSENIFRYFLSDTEYLNRFPFFNGIASDGVVQLSKPTEALVTLLFRNVIDEAGRTQSIYAMDMVRVCLLKLFLLVNEEVGNGSSTEKQMMQPNRIVLDNFRRLVNRHFATYKLPKDYAALLYITPNHLNAVCQDLLGKSAGEIIRERVLMEAKRLLVNADTTISDIAYQLNFADNSYFTKFFKKYTGTTPEIFKRNIQ